MIKFILGGARSGKTSFAIEAASKYPPKRIYIATALPIDDEMRERIDTHKKERGKRFETWEIPYNLLEILDRPLEDIGVFVLDCITIWTANAMMEDIDPFSYMRGFIDKLKDIKHNIPFYMVSNEVGMGIVPSNPLSRKYRDILGKVNTLLAQEAEEVYFMVAGIPWKLK